MKKINCKKEKAQELARKFGVSQDVVDEFEYNDEPVLPVVKEADKEKKNVDLAVDRLRSLIERIERLEEEKKALASDIKDVFAEAKAAGFDTKAMRACIRLRKMNAADRDEQEFLLDTYRKALDL